MNSYLCNNNHTFLFPAIKTVHTPGDGGISYPEDLETRVCPYCGTDIIVEAPEDVVSSVKQVNYDEVDALLKQGYTVQSYYASKVTLTKKEA